MLKQLLFKWLSEDSGISAKVEKFQGVPAVFYGDAPDDKPGWDGENHYPRICYHYDLRRDQEDSSDGKLWVAVEYSGDSGLAYELELRIKEILAKVLMKGENEAHYGFSLLETERVVLDAAHGAAVVIRFDIAEYLFQETFDPDPVYAMMAYIKQYNPDGIMLGLERGENFTILSERPVIYCRSDSIEKGQENHTSVWMNCNMAIHVLHLDRRVRQKLTTGLAASLSLDGDIHLLDGSPLQVKELVVNHGNNYLKAGQITLKTSFGLLKYRSKKATLQRISFD